MKAKSAIALLSIAAYVGGCGDGLLTDADPESASLLREATRENLVVAAKGLAVQPVQLEVTVPVSSSLDIVSARLRWAGRALTSTGDPFLIVNSHQRTATLLASYQVGGDLPWVFIYEFDVLGLIRPGLNRLNVSGFNLGTGSRADGVGVFVVYRDPTSPWTSVLLADPREFVQAGAGSVWSFPIGTSIAPRSGHFVLFAGDCSSASTDRVWWSAGPGGAPADLVGAPYVVNDALTAALGQRMDILSQDVALPGWTSHFAYQLESPADGSGDSIVHFFGAFCSDGEGTFCTGSISGRVWHDDDRDGVEDPGEPGMPGVSVRLEDGLGTVLTSSATDGSGGFSFSPLCTGDWVVAVDPATLPAGVEPTSCGVGDCSPLTVTLASDDAASGGVAFGYSEPPAVTHGCFFGLGWWKHEFSIEAELHGQQARVDASTREALLATVEAATRLDWSGGDGVLDARDVAAALDALGSDPCASSERHYLACLLNYALNGAPRSMIVDTDGDSVPDMTWGEMIDAADALFAQGTDEPCRRAKAMAAAVNETASWDCPY